MATTLATVAVLDDLFSKNGIQYWIFGGFAVDFHVGEETRVHDDVDVAVLHEEFARAAALLSANGWKRVASGEGYATFLLADAQVDLAPVQRDDPAWPEGAFGEDVRVLDGVRARVVTRSALIADKSERRDDVVTRAKDTADLRRLTRR